MSGSKYQFSKEFYKLQKQPSYPTIGTLLNRFAVPVGLKEKQKSTPSFKRKLQYLANEADEVDPDTHEDILRSIIDEYEKLTTGYPNHWMSGSQFFHYFRAYQQLILHIRCFGLSQQNIENFVAYYFLFMIVNRYSWWVKNYPYLSSKHTVPWFLISDSSLKKGFDACIGNAKNFLGNREMTDWEFVTMLYPQYKGDKPSIKAVVSQLKKWGTTATAPQLQTFKDKIIKPLQAVNEEAALVLEVDFVGWRWIGEILGLINVEFHKTSTFFSELFYEMENVDDLFTYQVPSDFTIDDNLLEPRISEVVFVLLSNILKPKEFEIWMKESCGKELMIPEFSTQDPIVAFAALKEISYRDGPSYREFSNFIFQEELRSKSTEIKHVFRNQYLHGLLYSSYKSSLSWLDRQMDSSLVLGRSYINTLELKKWLQERRRKNINESAKWGKYHRTALLMAIASRNLNQVKKFTTIGADLSWISENSKKYPGDNSSALLFAAQSIYVSLSKIQKQKSRQIMRFVIKDLRENYSIEEQRLLLETKTRLSKICPISQIIESVEKDLLLEMLKIGPDLKRPLGGDDLYPIYLVVNTYKHYLDNQLPIELQISEMKNGHFNPLRMIVSPEILRYIMHDQSDFDDFLEKVLQHKSDLLPDNPTIFSDIIYMLREAGADTNVLSYNGRYPLDLAYEIKEKHNDTLILETLLDIGEYKRAIY